MGTQCGCAEASVKKMRWHGSQPSNLPCSLTERSESPFAGFGSVGGSRAAVAALRQSAKAKRRVSPTGQNRKMRVWSKHSRDDFTLKSCNEQEKSRFGEKKERPAEGEA